MSENKATLIGLLAILLWSLIVGLIRSVSESFGPVGGAALIYTLASVFLIFSLGWTKVRQLPKKYLLWGSLLFVAYELCLALSIGYAKTSRQAIEVGMVNYLWPSLTIVFAILFNRQKSSLWIVPGFALSTLGICWILGGEQGLDFSSMWVNVQDNPLSYGLAFAGALIWAAYCTVTTRIAKGKNGITLFFVLVALALWIQYLFAGESAMDFNVRSLINLVLAAGAMGFGYAAWNVGILHGRITLLAGASYFIPVLSAALAAVMLSTPLSAPFWQGAAMVCIGSVLCWRATRSTKTWKGEPPPTRKIKIAP